MAQPRRHHRVLKHPRICRECGGPLPADRVQQPVYLCSDECRRNRKNRPRRAPRFQITCVVCQAIVETADGQQRYCSLECRRIRRRVRGLRVCRYCEVPFVPTHARHFSCSTRCNRAQHYRENRDRYVSQARERKAHVRHVRVETFTGLEIFERDGWVCGICREPVDAELVAPSLMRRSLDHVIPIARGGLHSRANVQLAHLLCNLRKNDRILEQKGDHDALEADRAG